MGFVTEADQNADSARRGARPETSLDVLADDGDTTQWLKHHYYYSLGSVFSAPEVQAVLATARAREPRDGTLESKDGRKIREATLFWVNLEPTSAWIFDRLNACVTTWNRDFGLELQAGGPRFCQISRYEAGQKYGWHMDLGRGATSLRKVSLVVALNQSSEYEGGGLEFFYGNRENPIVRLQAGEAVLFPAYTMHRAIEVRQGVRWTLAAWFRGDVPFR